MEDVSRALCEEPRRDIGQGLRDLGVNSDVANNESGYTCHPRYCSRCSRTKPVLGDRLVWEKVRLEQGWVCLILYYTCSRGVDTGRYVDFVKRFEFYIYMQALSIQSFTSFADAFDSNADVSRPNQIDAVHYYQVAHMPRWASRFDSEIRVSRFVHSISQTESNCAVPQTSSCPCPPIS